MAEAGYEQYKKAWQKRKQQEELEVMKLRLTLKEKVKICADEIKKLGGKRVILFGSLASDRFQKGSDVDIAVDGLTPEAYFKALGVAEEIFGDVPFDLVDIDEVLPMVRRRIEREGLTIAQEDGGVEV